MQDENKGEMNMRVRNLSMGMEGEDVKLLHDELERLGYRIPQDEKKKKYFGDKTHNTVIRFKKKHKLSPTGIVDAQTAKLINKAVKALKPQHKLFMVKGAVRRKVRTPFPDAVVKAFDKDMRQEQLLGVANTDQKGHYEITYSRDRFRRAEKKSADLIVRVYDPKAADLILGESKRIFNAQPVEVVNLAVTQTFSEYEQYMATIGPVRENIPVSELSKEDIVFLSSETGIEIQRIEFLVTAARLSKQTELPPEVFYGLFRQGKPTILSDLLERDSTDLRDALESALDDRIIPSRLRKDIDQHLNSLKQLAEVDPGIQIKKQKTKLHRLGKVVKLSDAKREAVVKKVSSPSTISDRELASLVEAGELEKEEAKELGLTVSLYGLLDENFELTEAIKKGDFPQMPRGRVTHVEDLISFNKEDWLSMIKKANVVEPPGGLKQEDYAAFLSRKVEILYPSKTLWARMKPEKTEALTEDIDDLQPLFDRNEKVFGVDRFERLDIAGISEGEVEKLRKGYSHLKHLSNAYPGLRIGEILDDHRLSISEKKKETSDRIELLSRFQAQNLEVEFLALDYGPDSEDLQALDFTGFSSDQQSMVLKTLKAYQRMYSITSDATHTRLLLEMGHHSPISITNMSRENFVMSTGQDRTVAQAYYNNACASTTNMYINQFGVLDAYHAGSRWSHVDNSDPSIDDYLKKFDGWEKFFGSLDYCQCKHCRSILSPAAYFVDLMRFVKMHIIDEFFIDREKHPLHLRSRRPDLWKLPLTCENTHTLVPYLDIINEILENYIYLQQGHVEAELPETGVSDRSSVEGEVYETLLDSADSFSQPFSLPLERLDTYLTHFDVTRGDITKLLDEPRDIIAAATLNLSKQKRTVEPKREYELITERGSEMRFLQDMYGLRFVRRGSEVTYREDEEEESENDVQLLLKSMGVTREEFGELIETTFVRTGADPFVRTAEYVWIESEKKDDESVQNDIERIHGLSRTVLDRMHRFSRLWRHVPWSIKDLDLVLYQLARSDLVIGIEEVTLQFLTDILSVQKRFGLSIEELCTLWSDLPDIPVVYGKESFFDRLFNLSDFVRLDGKFPVNTMFLHPAFRDIPPAEVDYIPNRLLAGLRVNDETLYLLITHLIRPLRELEADSPEPAYKDFPLTIKNLSLLYRHARLAELLRLSIPQLFQLIRLAPAITSDHIAGLGDLSEFLEFYDWLKSTDFSPDDLAFITGGSVENPEAYPDAEAITAKLLQKVKAEQSVIFTHNVFAFLEGVTEEQSQKIIADNTGAIFDKARGMRYRVAEGLDEDSEIVIPDMPDGSPIPANPEDVRAVLLTYHKPSLPVFDDTVFTEIKKETGEPLTREESQAIVASNPVLIEPVPLENAYWLVPSFAAAALTIPAGIPVTGEKAKYLLYIYHAAEVIPNHLAGELSLPVEKIKALIYLADIDLAEQIYTEAIKGDGPTDCISDLIKTILPLTVLFKDSAFNIDALDFIGDSIRDYPALFGNLNVREISLENIRMLSIYRGFLPEEDDTADRQKEFHDLLLSFDPAARKFYTGDDDKQNIQSKLAQALGAEVGLVVTVHDEISLGNTALEALAKLKRCIEFASSIGVGGEVLKFIVSNDYNRLNKAANAILSAFRTKYENEDEWQEKIQPFEDKIRSRKRDALTDYLIRSLEPKVFDTLNDLYHYFLIDIELEGCARTSWIVAANSSVQLYVHRILMNLEQDRAGEIQILLPEDAIEEWEWRKNYRVWEANRKIFLYPENYLEPDLRDNKTPLFKELESTLLQQEINEDTVPEAYASYMRGFDEVANLKIAGTYHDIGDETDFLHLFGVTASEPPVYYYRSVENAYHGERDDTIGIVWHPWRKIDVQIPVRKVSPIVFNARLYVFWVEIVTRPENSRFSGGSSHFVGYKHTLSLKFTTLRLDGTWTPPQKLKLDTHPFDKGEGVIEDLFATGRSEVIEIGGEEFGAVVPCYGTEKDKHSSGMLVDEILEQIPENEDGGIDPSAIVENENSDVKPKDDYTLEGFQWEQVYPHPRYYENAIIITGRDFQMRSKIDLYRLAIGRRDLYHGAEIAGRILSWNMENQVLYWGLAPSSLRSWLDPYAYASILIDQRRIEYYRSKDFVGWDSEAIELLRRNLYRFTVARNLNSSAEISVINGSFNDGLIDYEGDLLYIQARPANFGENPLDYLVKRLGTTLAGDVSSRLFEVGVERLLSLDSQMELKEWELPINIESDCFAEDRSNTGIIDWTGPYGVYYREIFFHIPFIIANHLNSQQKFAAAQEWYHYIFNPTASETDSTPEDRNWRYLEFRNRGVDSLRDQLADPLAIETYKRDPFNPHAIARLPLRFSAYQKAIVMKYIDNLLDWGDSLFAQDTMESINEATLLYVLASDILGERPAELGECGEVDSKTYKEIASILDEENEFLIEMYHGVQSKNSRPQKQIYDYTIDPASIFLVTKNANDHVTTRVCKKAGYAISGDVTGISADSASSALSTGRMEISMEKTTGLKKEGIFRGTGWASVPKQETNFKYIYTFLVAFGNQLGPVFCVPPNEEFENYWDRVEDRLFKIQNCMNISGLQRELSLFAPEISPMFLIRAKAAGLSIEDVLNSISGNLPPYRFSYVIERAKSYAAALQGFGAALLSALEKKDIEELNLLHTVHQQNILKQTTQVQQWEIDAAAETYQSLQKRKESVEYRMGHYQELIDEGLNPAETLQTVSKGVASGLRIVAAGLDTAAAIMYLVPQVGSPFAMKYGGREIGESGTTWSEVFQTSAQIFDEVSALAGLAAGFQRREEDWQHQADLADHELNELDRQIKATEIRLDIANKTMEIHEKTIEQQDEIYEFYCDKFSNIGLYTWLSTALQRLYREAYNSAFAVARLAEQAYRFERGDDAAELIGSNHWEASKAGLLAGERLLIDLQNLERRFLETNYRSMEINQAFSLTQINPAALIPLKETGTCQFEIPEIFFDMFYPGHYRRRIKAVRLTIPCITGPYTNVSATLTLLSSKLRNEPKIDEPARGLTYLRDVPRTRTVSIATSTAQNDAGVFELNFRDERYMPFEGAGAISTWKLELPGVFRHFDYNSISDVIFHISYTAKDDGLFKETVETELQRTLRKYADDNDLIRLFSMKHEFSNELHRFLYPPTEEADQEITMTIDRKNFPYFLHEKTISVIQVELILKLKPGCELSGQEIALVRGADAATGGEDLEPYSTEDPDFADLYTATCEISGEISDGDQWTLKVTAGRLDPDVVEDIGLLFYYTIKSESE